MDGAAGGHGYQFSEVLGLDACGPGDLRTSVAAHDGDSAAESVTQCDQVLSCRLDVVQSCGSEVVLCSQASHSALEVQSKG